MYEIVGHCPKCGAPIYAPSMWHGIIPPPSQYSCNCHSNIGTIISQSSQAIEEKNNNKDILKKDILKFVDKWIK